MEINLQELNTHLLYNLFMGSVVPRPIAWVSTMNSEGQLNLAPFSSLNMASFAPPVIMFAPTLKTIEKEGIKVVVPKDTLRNIGNNYEFVVNIVSYDLVEKMEKTSYPFSPDVNEFEKVGLTPEPSTRIKVPRVKEAKISFECTLKQIINFGSHDLAGNLVLGDIVAAHVTEGIWSDGHVNQDLLNAVGRMAGNEYCKTNERYALGTPTLAKK